MVMVLINKALFGMMLTSEYQKRIAYPVSKERYHQRKAQFNLNALCIDNQCKVFNQLDSPDKHSMVMVSHHWNTLGTINRDSVVRFIGDPFFRAHEKDLFRIIKIVTDSQFTIQNESLEPHIQNYICNAFKSKSDEIDQQTNNKLNAISIVKNKRNSDKYCMNIEGSFLGKFNTFIYEQCAMAPYMNEDTQKKVQELRDDLRKNNSLDVIERCAEFRFFIVGSTIFSLSLPVLLTFIQVLLK